MSDFWSKHSINGTDPDHPDTRGVQARRAQLKSAAQDVDPSMEAKSETAGRVMGGSAAEPAHRELSRARGALNRQLRTARGQSLYKNGKFVGNEPPDEDKD